MSDSTPLTTDQLAAILRHSPRAVARTATELAFAASRGQSGPWQAFRAAWCALYGISEAEAVSQLQTLVYEVCDD